MRMLRRGKSIWHVSCFIKGELKQGGKEVRSSVRMLTVSAILAVGFVSSEAAQKMGGDRSHMTQMKADSSSLSGQMGMKSNTEPDTEGRQLHDH